MHVTTSLYCLLQLDKDNPKVNAIYVVRGSVEGKVNCF